MQELQYLLFDASDDASGRGSFDALASVLPARVGAVLDEAQAVLRWAHVHFDAPAPGDTGEWDFALHATQEPGRELRLVHPEGKLVLDGVDPQGGHVTLAFTLSGSGAFCAALREAFDLAA